MRIAREERLVAIVLGGLALLVVIGGLAGVYLSNRYQEVVVRPWRDPRAALNWQRIAPLLALSELGQSSVSALVGMALEQGQVDTAFAALVYAIDLRAPERSSLLLYLAQSEAAGRRPAIRLACYQMAACVATVAADMPDVTRIATLVQVARGMAEQRASATALYYLDQAYAVARFSDELAPAHRRVALDQLVPLYQRLGRKPDSWQPLAEQVLATASPVTQERTTPLELGRPQLQYLSEPVTQAAASRQRMVQEILHAAGAGQSALNQYQREDLASVLRHEDERRQQAYRAQTDARASAAAEAGVQATGEQIALARDRVAWNVLRSRIAHRGFGMSIVPEWEQQANGIDAELRAAEDALYEQYLRAVGPERRLAVLMLQLEHGLLGFYPDPPQREWAAELQGAKPERALHVAARTEGRYVYFRLVGNSAF